MPHPTSDDELYRICEEINQKTQKYEKKDKDFYLEKIAERIPELGKKTEQIEVASLALLASNSMVMLTEELDRNPTAPTPQYKPSFKRDIFEKLAAVKDWGNAQEVNRALSGLIPIVENAGKSVPNGPAKKAMDKCTMTLKQCASDLKEIIMGVKVDHTGTTRLSHATSQVLGGPLGTVLGLGFNKLQAESSNNQVGVHISDFVTKSRNELGLDLKHAAMAVLPIIAPKAK